MPPSGFNQKAIKGLLEFVKANYEAVSEKYSGTPLITESEVLEVTSGDLEKQVRTLMNERFPGSERLNGGVEGLTIFVTECYRDLVYEIAEGKDKYGRLVVDGKAIRKELDQIGSYLEGFRI